jgi:predicted dinucleotide-binding enzyme
MTFGIIGAGTIAQALAGHLVTASPPNPRHPAGRQILFYAGDDAEAKASFHELVDGFGFAPVDIGSLREGGRLMQVDGGPLSALHALRQD